MAELRKTDQSSSTPVQTAVLDVSYLSDTRHKLKVDGKPPPSLYSDGGFFEYHGQQGKTDWQYLLHWLHSTGCQKTRPLTFVFNGGFGAASAYLHMGALGPQAG